MIQKLFVPLYNCFGTAGFVLLGLSFLQYHQTFDVHVHDTYLVIGINVVFILLGCLFLVLWMVYQLFKKRLYSLLMANIHTLLTLVAIAVLFLPSSGATAREAVDISTYQTGNQVAFYAMVVFLLAQVLLLFNIIAGLFKK